jgi:iron complex transport system substrate-binding protein
VRVATVAWANHEVPLALGVVPVGFAAANFGDDDGDGLLPWVAEKLKELGGEKPVLFDEGDGIDFEAVAATKPDVILAAYSGLSRSDYETLSQIAPVVAYPQSPWSTDWRETIRLDSAGLGMAAEGEALISRIEKEIADTVAGYPILKGKSAIFVTHLDVTNLSTVNFYTANDTRVKFFADLGLTSPKSVLEATKPGQFAASVSAEKVDAFDDVDIVVAYGGTPLLDAVKADLLLSRMPAVGKDALVMLGRDPTGTAANPTPLSISWVLKDYVALLAEAAGKAK